MLLNPIFGIDFALLLLFIFIFRFICLFDIGLNKQSAKNFFEGRSTL